MPAIGRSISFGVGESAEGAGDVAMTMEIARADVTLTSYDFVNNRLVFKAVLPNTFAARVYEVGLWSQSSNNLAGSYGSRNLTTFDTAETWTVAPIALTTARVGAEALRLNPLASATMTSSNGDVVLDLSGYSGADTFVFGYNVGNAFTSAVRVRFLTDLNNYYTFTIAAPTAGYKVTSLSKSGATATGNPNWGSITQIDVEVTSTAGGQAQVDFDAVRIEDVDTLNPDYVLVSRELVSPVYVKTVGSVQEIEYSLAVTIT